MSKPVLHVAVGVLQQPDGRVLLGERPTGKPWEGWWELPGGKLEPGETTLQALARELQEELGIVVTQAWPWVNYVHEYPKNIVHLDFCRVTAWTGTPRGLEGQRLAWVHPGSPEENTGSLLPAAWPPLRWLRLPDRYYVSADQQADGWPDTLAQLTRALADGIRLVQFRQPAWAARAGACDPALHNAFRETIDRCRKANALCLVNSVHPEAWWPQADGVHLRAGDLGRAAALRPDPLPEGPTPDIPWLSASVHNALELSRAAAARVDFAVLGPVAATLSHPGQAGLGWSAFRTLQAGAGLPLYAIGGQSPATLEQAWTAGAHGIAGIRHMLRPEP